MTVAANFASRLESVIGSSHVSSDPAVCAGHVVDEIIPRVVAKPFSAEEVAEVVRFAALEKLALIPCGHRTKLEIGMPPSRYDIALDMTGLNKIAHYDPGDLTVSVDAGLPLGNLNASLLEHRQFLPLLVPWYSRGTVGGVIASGVDSPMLHFYGTARDFLIGAEFVDGTGRLCKSGGRVVKNVTGYDFHKLLIGSVGTLAVITRLNFRTFPSLPATRGFVASFADAEAALAFRGKIAKSSLAPLTFDLLDPGMAHVFATRAPTTPEPAVFVGESRASNEASLPAIGDWFRSREWQVCAAFGGTPEVLERYEGDLARLAEEFHPTATAILDDSSRPSLWGRLRETLSLLVEASPACTIFKLSLLPSQHGSLFKGLHEVANRLAIPYGLVARASGSIYFGLLPSTNDAAARHLLEQAATAVFSLCASKNVSLTFPWCPTQLKRSINVWGPPRPDLALMRRLKAAFDPQNLFAPSRFLT